jgi:hypothetical protein
MSFNVHFTYDPASGGYALKMTGMKNKLDWEQLKLFTGAVKGCIASSDRDYDPNQKTWYIDPKHFKTVKILIESAFDKSNIFIIEAPEASEQGYTQTFHSSEADLTKLGELVKENPQTLKLISYNEAKKLYRRFAMTYHPDRNGGDGSRMSELNEVWTRLSNSTTRDFWKDYVPVETTVA